MTFAHLSEPDADRAEAEPTGPACSRCGKRTVLSASGWAGSTEPNIWDLFACPTDGEFYVDSEGWATRQVFLDDSAPTHAVPVEVATELDEEDACEF